MSVRDRVWRVQLLQLGRCVLGRPAIPLCNRLPNPFPRRATFGRVPAQDLGGRTKLAGTTGRGLDPEDGPERSGECLRLFVCGFQVRVGKQGGPQGLQVNAGPKFSGGRAKIVVMSIWKLELFLSELPVRRRIEMQKVNESDLTHLVPPKHGVDGLGKLGAAGLVDAANVHPDVRDRMPLHLAS